MGSFVVEETREESGADQEHEGRVTKTLSSHSKTMGTVQVVEFLLGDEHFAVDLFDTREVITTTEVTPIPNSLSFITGMIDLRGTITTIIDLKDMMHIGQEGSGKRKSRIIILDQSVSEKRVGILVGDVYSVSTYRRDEIDRTAQSEKDGHEIIGVIRKHQSDKNVGKLIIWLDIKKMIKRIEKDL
jgi:purine-binding chemotaxis protein CheW